LGAAWEERPQPVEDPNRPGVAKTNIVDHLNKFSGALLAKSFQEGSRGAVGPNRLLAPSFGDRGFPLFDPFWGQRFEPFRGGAQRFDLRGRCAGAGRFQQRRLIICEAEPDGDRFGLLGKPGYRDAALNRAPLNTVFACDLANSAFVVTIRIRGRNLRRLLLFLRKTDPTSNLLGALKVSQLF
jgi:hypothetical protein